MVQLVVGSILHDGHIEHISRFSQCSTTGVTKAVVGYVLSCLWDNAYKTTLAANLREYLIWRQRVSSLTI